MLLLAPSSEATDLVFCVVVAALAGVAGHGVVRGGSSGKQWMVVAGWLFLAPYIYVFSKVVISQGAKHPLQAAIVLLGPLAVVAALSGPAILLERRARAGQAAADGNRGEVGVADSVRQGSLSETPGRRESFGRSEVVPGVYASDRSADAGNGGESTATITDARRRALVIAAHRKDCEKAISEVDGLALDASEKRLRAVEISEGCARQVAWYEAIDGKRLAPIFDLMQRTRPDFQDLLRAVPVPSNPVAGTSKAAERVALSASPESIAHDDPAYMIERLKKLLDMGAITEDEYVSKKRELLGRL